MDGVGTSHLTHHRLPSLADEVDALGGVWILCDQRGALIDIGPSPADAPLAAALSRSREFAHMLQRAIAATAFGLRQPAVEVCQGLHLVLCPSISRRVNAMGVAVLPTSDFAYGGDVETLARSASVEVERLRSSLLARDLPSSGEIARLARLIRLSHRAVCERDAEIAVGEAASWQLAESYEEINLLYSLVSGSRAAETPAQFMHIACDELVRTLGFAWAATVVGPGALESDAPEACMAAGAMPCERASLHALIARLVQGGHAEAPRIFPRGSEVLEGRMGESAVVLCPIRGEKGTIGALVAGERRERNGEVASIDLKLVDATAGHIAIALENARLYRDLDRMFLGTLEAIVNAIDAKDPYTRGHSQRVALLSRELAGSLGMDDVTLRHVHIAGLIHDVGKIGVPEAVLRKSGKLDDAEFAQIRLHPEIGWRILHDIPQFSEMLDGVLSHHERWDGCGYPNGLAGERIPLVARIIALADSFDAMSSNRTYRSRRPREVVLGEIQRCAGTQFDPKLVWPFLRLDFSEYDRMHAEHEASAIAGQPVLRRAA